jgi:maleate cis-trans isomerase
MARDLMAYEPLDFIAVTGDLYQAALGPEWNRSMRESVERETGVPATTAMTAVVDALREMGITRPVLGSPVSEAKNAPVRDYLEASGFIVPAMVGLDAGSSRALRRLPREAPYEVALRAFEAGQAAGGTDGIYLPSLSWGATQFAARLEAELGVPVITLYNSLVWRALIAIGYPTPMTGHGAILERVGG